MGPEKSLMVKQIKRARRPYVRALKTGYRRSRHAIRDNSPGWFGRFADPVLEYVDVFFVDHGVFRAIYPNRHRLSDRAWRSSQPAPHDIRVMARRGVRTIINLRGERDCGTYRLEQAACEKYGVTLVDFSVKSRQAPPSRAIREAKELFESVEYPILMHCKSGADRVGLMSALYMIFQEGAPVEEAKRQLSLRYGHIRQADTGVLDHVFDSYLAHRAHEPVPFLDWVERHYDGAAVDRSFKAGGLANLVVNKVLRRE